MVTNLVTQSAGIHHHDRRKREREREARKEGICAPIDVSNIEDLAVEARHLWVAATILDRDRGLAQVGAHGEVGDGSDEGDADGDVVKHPMGAWFGEGMPDEGKGSCQHQGTHGLRTVEHLRSDSM